MATAITFPVPLTLPSRRHRAESVTQRAERTDAVRRHPSSNVPVSTALPAPASVVISCSDCSRQNSSACVDCVVTFVCGSVVTLGPDEARALAMLQSAGLVPGSRHDPVFSVA